MTHKYSFSLRPEYKNDVYFPMMISIYDIHGNALLVNEYVIMDGSYVFQRFEPAVYLLIGKTRIHQLR